MPLTIARLYEEDLMSDAEVEKSLAEAKIK
jgi:hypothetical protein